MCACLNSRSVEAVGAHRGVSGAKLWRLGQLLGRLGHLVEVPLRVSEAFWKPPRTHVADTFSFLKSLWSVSNNKLGRLSAPWKHLGSALRQE